MIQKTNQLSNYLVYFQLENTNIKEKTHNTMETITL